MARKNSFVYYYPFLLALYPVLFLYVHNIDRVPLRETLRTGAAVLLATGLLFGLVWLIFRSAGRAALFSAWVLLLFSSFGHVYGALAGKTIFGMANVLAALWAALLILVGWAILRLVRRPEVFGPPLNIFTAVLIVLPLLQAGGYLLNHASALSGGQQVAGTASTDPMLHWQGEGTRPPDIYYIILDAYGRSDILAEIMGVDNRDFLEGLRARGFYIAEQSHANYHFSDLSIAASLNSDFVTPDPNYSPYSAENRLVMMDAIHANRVQRLLETAGYRSITFASGYFPTEIKQSDEYVEPPSYINSFEVQYLEGTLLLLSPRLIYTHRTRSIILTPLELLPQIAEQDPAQPKFIFVHIPAAHAPFVFGPQGESVRMWTFTDSSRGNMSYQQVYGNQLQYINRKVLATVDGILDNAPVPPIIILQGDHGTELLMQWNDPTTACLKERFSILNAYYLPDAARTRLYPEISPVNTFRVIFDSLYGTHFGLLPDRSFFAYLNKGGQYTEVTDQVNTCAGRDP